MERCPACSYATIMPDAGVRVLVCGNPQCGKQTCRLCKEDSHVPLACDEVEKDAEVAELFWKARKCSVWNFACGFPSTARVLLNPSFFGRRGNVAYGISHAASHRLP